MTKRYSSLKLLSASLAAVAVSIAFAGAQTIAIQNARVYTMAQSGPEADQTGGGFNNGDVIIRDGVIAGVGQDLPVPEGARVINAQGRVVTPGLFAPWSQIGLMDLDLDAEANDSSTDSDFPLSAALDATDAFNPGVAQIAVNRAGGVTRAVSAPEPGNKMFGGQGAIVDLSGRPASVMRANALQSVAMGSAGIGYNGGTRLGNWAALREALDEARAYAANPGAYAMRPRQGGLSLGDLEALGPVAQGRQPLVVSVSSVTDIRTLIKLKAQYGVNAIILGGTEAHLIATEIAAANIPVILNPWLNLPSQFEDLGATQANAAKLNAAGVTIAFYDPPSGTHNLRLLPQLAGNAVANGLPYGAALKALTVNPARIFGVSDRLGTLEIGKAADVVIWDGDPLEISTRPIAVLIDGRVTSLKNRQTMLRDRYKDLSRGDLPHAYRGAQ